MDNFIDVMLDLETLGIQPGCKILQISATTFNLPRGKCRRSFDYRIDRHSQAGLKEDADTLKWWMGQEAFVREGLFNNPNAAPLVESLEKFATWLGILDGDVRLWGNGVRFDNAILEYAYQFYDIPVPWDTKLERCFRTLKAIGGPLVSEPTFVGNKHNALHDAIHQANYAELIINRIKGSR